MGRTKIKTLTIGLLMTLGGLTACNRVGDQYCDVGSVPEDAADQCPYGTANNVHVELVPCPEIPKSQDCTTELSWSHDIWPLLVKGPATPAQEMAGELGGGSCAAGNNCHDHGQSRGVQLNKPDPKQPFVFEDAAWNVLTHYRGGQDTTYLGSRNSWILCNLQPRNAAGGITMPPSKEGLSKASFDYIKKWAECDQKQYTIAEQMMRNPGGT